MTPAELETALEHAHRLVDANATAYVLPEGPLLARALIALTAEKEAYVIVADAARQLCAMPANSHSTQALAWRDELDHRLDAVRTDAQLRAERGYTVESLRIARAKEAHRE